MNPLYQCKRPAGADTVWEAGCGFIWMRGETTFFENPRNRFMRFRRRFHLDFEPVGTELRIFTDTLYQLWVNGESCGRGPSRSDFTCTYYDCYDVVSQLKRGDNCVAVLVLFQGFGTGRGMSILQGMLFQLVIHGAGGERVVIVSDSQWRADPAPEFMRPTPRLHGPLGCIEVQDMRLHQADWQLLDFNDSKWSQSDYIKPDLRIVPWYYFVPSPIPPRHESRWDSIGSIRLAYGDCELPAVECLGEPRCRPRGYDGNPGIALPCVLPAVESGRYAQVVTLDFARIESGLLRLEVEGVAGTVIDALLSDSLAPGDVIPKPEQARILTGRWILKDGRQRLEIVFNWLAFRYVQLWIWSPQPVILHQAWIRTLYYPLPESGGDFDCSDPFLVWLDGICSHTVRLCYQDAIVDSPSREQQQWIGDARKTAVYNHYRWGDRLLHRNLIEQIGQGMDWMGTMVVRYPSGNRNITPIPSYCLDWIGAFEDYFRYTGDDSLLPVWWPNILLAIRWFSAFERNGDGLLENVPHWLYIDMGADASGRGMGTGEVLTSLNIQYLAALRAVAGYAQRLGETGSHEWFTARSEQLVNAIRETLWDAEAGIYADALSESRLTRGASEVTAALALLHLETGGGERSDSILHNVFFNSGDDVVRCSPFSVQLVLDALVLCDQRSQALNLIRERYRPLKEAGATATWEHWNVFDKEVRAAKVTYPRCASSCHAWGAAPMAFFTGVILGIQPTAPGWEQVEIRPFVGDLDRASGSCLTQKGRITVDWKVQDGIFQINVVVPDGIGGRILLPDGSLYQLPDTHDRRDLECSYSTMTIDCPYA